MMTKRQASQAKKQDSYVIAILGAGPAGSATALSFFQAFKTLTAEQKSQRQVEVHLFDSPRSGHWQVGESIPPAATPLLQALGAEDIVSSSDFHLDCPGSISLWNSDKPGHNDFLLDLIGRGYHLNRKTFDAQLLQKAYAAGIHYHHEWRLTRVDEQDENGRWPLQFSVKQSLHETLKADFVVDASGKTSAFARRLNVYRNVLDEVIFLSTFVELDDDCDVLKQTLVEAVADGWWYAARLPHNRMVIMFCTDLAEINRHQWQLPVNWLGQLDKTRWLKNQLGGVYEKLANENLQIGKHAAPSSLLSAVCGENWLAVGDAASSYDPITSAGITKALQQGKQAGEALAEKAVTNNSGKMHAYQQQVFDDFVQYARVRSELYSSEQRFTDSAFWLRRLGLAQPEA